MKLLYKMVKLEKPLDILTDNGVRLIGVTEIGTNDFSILYGIEKRIHIEKNTNYTIIEINKTT